MRTFRASISATWRSRSRSSSSSAPSASRFSASSPSCRGDWRRCLPTRARATTSCSWSTGSSRARACSGRSEPASSATPVRAWGRSRTRPASAHQEHRSEARQARRRGAPGVPSDDRRTLARRHRRAKVRPGDGGRGAGGANRVACHAVPGRRRAAAPRRGGPARAELSSGAAPRPRTRLRASRARRSSPGDDAVVVGRGARLPRLRRRRRRRRAAVTTPCCSTTTAWPTTIIDRVRR